MKLKFYFSISWETCAAVVVRLSEVAKFLATFGAAPLLTKSVFELSSSKVN